MMMFKIVILLCIFAKLCDSFNIINDNRQNYKNKNNHSRMILNMNHNNHNHNNHNNNQKNILISKLSSFKQSSLTFLSSLLVILLLPLQSHAVYRTGKKSILASSSSSTATKSNIDSKSTTKGKNNHKIDVEVVITDDDDNNNNNNNSYFSKSIDYQKYGLIAAGAVILLTLLSPTDNNNNTKKSNKSIKSSTPKIYQKKKVVINKKDDDDDDQEDEDVDEDDNINIPNPSFRSRMKDRDLPSTSPMSANMKKLISSSDLLKPPDDLLDVFDDEDEDVIDMKNLKKSKNPKVDEDFEDDDLFADTTPVKKGFKGTTAKKFVTNDDDLFADDSSKNVQKAVKRGNDDNDDDDDSNNNTNNKISSSFAKKFKNKMETPKVTTDDDDEDDLFINESNNNSKSITKLESSPPQQPAPPTPTTPTPVPPTPQKKNIFQKIFTKPGAGRITDITQVLRLDDASQEMRLLVANCLKSYVSADLFDFEGSPYQTTDTNDDESLALLVTNAMSELDLTAQDTANAFADVASAMLVTLTDTASNIYDEKDHDMEMLLLALDDIAEFVRGAGLLFSKATPGAAIEPVLYNGKVKSGKLENLYLEYLKSTMSMDSLLGMLGGETEQSDSKDQEEKAKKLEYRSNGLIRIQQVFSIKEGKRNSLEQKVTKDMLMNMAKGEGGLGNIGDMMSALTGKGGGGLGDMDMEALMKSMGAEGGGLPPDMANMSQEEMAAMSNEAMSSVKEALKTGGITKDDIKEFEKMMGFDVKTITSMIEKGQLDKKKLEALGPEGAEILEIFKQLGKIN